MPDLTGRQAKCAYGDNIQPSSPDLAFFEYLGEGSREALNICKECRYDKGAHRYFPYYYPGRCPDCNEDTLSYIGQTMGSPNKIWMCGECGVLSSDEEVRGHRRPTPMNLRVKQHDFEPRGSNEYDRYYCGCHGWD